jgi:hypothetical protein
LKLAFPNGLAVLGVYCKDVKAFLPRTTGGSEEDAIPNHYGTGETSARKTHLPGYAFVTVQLGGETGFVGEAVARGTSKGGPVGVGAAKG